MASPFRVFRKNVKPLLAVMVVLLMLSWVVGDSLTSYLSGSRGANGGSDRDAQAVAVRWDGDSLTNAEVGDLVHRRRILNEFLRQVEGGGAQSAYEAGIEPRPLRVQQMLGAETPQQGVEQSVVQTRLFADAARKAGMRVSDEAIVKYLDELGRNNVSRDQMRDVLNRFQSSGWHLSIDEVIDTLREEMLARNFLNSNEFAFGTITPEQRWRDWLRVNDRVVIEAAAFPAESFLVDVKEPTETELVAFFDQYKNIETGPDGAMLCYFGVELPSPVPGFRVPRKVDVQFIAANYDDFLSKAEEKVTDEEIKKYYDEHKDPMFIKADTGLIEVKDEKKDADKPPGAAPDTTNTDETAPTGEAEKPADAESKAATPTSPGSSTETEPVPEGDKSAPEEKSAESGDKQPPADEAKKSSQQGKPSSRTFRLAAFQDKATNDAPADAAGESADTKAPDAATQSDAPATPADTAVPAADSAAAGTPAAPGAAAAPSSTPSAPATSDAPKKPLEFQPLDEVKDQIRRQLAEGKVADELSALAAQLQEQLSGEYNKYIGEVLNAQAVNEQPPPPPKSLVDLAPLAEKHGLKHGQTGPVSFLQLREQPVGKSSVADSGRSLLSLLYTGKGPDLYQPISTVDLDGNRYVLMKMGDTPARVPALDEVRADVVQAWKRQKAADLAIKHAQELAKKAQEAKTPLTEFLASEPGVKVIRSDPFAELTGGDVGFVNGQIQQQPYRLSQPEGIEAPGREFLLRVFSLKDGEVGAALNNDHSAAYVIRVVEHQPPLDALRTAYLAEANSWPGQNAMSQGHAQEIAGSLVSDIMTGANLKWERPSDQVVEPDEQDEG